MSDELALEATGLVRRFRSVTAVDGVDLQVAPGEVRALLGPNGSGKSTTMSLLAGVVRPTSGTVRVMGVDLVSSPMQAKQLTGFVPDVGGLFPRLTGWEHMELAARLRSLDRSWERSAAELLERLDLTMASSRRTSTYSKGMSRRLLVALALLSKPGVLLLDEPFDGVDPTGSEVVLKMALESAAAGAAVVVSTHLMDVAERICDTVTIISEGRVRAEGTPSELVAPGSSLYQSYLQVTQEPRP